MSHLNNSTINNIAQTEEKTESLFDEVIQSKNGAPPKTWYQISFSERQQIENMIGDGLTPSQIGRKLGFDRSTIGREIKSGLIEKDSGRGKHERKTWLKDEDGNIDKTKVWVPVMIWVYSAKVAQASHEINASKKGPTNFKIHDEHVLIAYLNEAIIGTNEFDAQSPDEALGKAKLDKIQGAENISTSTLYRLIHGSEIFTVQNSDLPFPRAEKREFAKRARDKKRLAFNNTRGRSIDKRPEYINDRSEFGHWEMDLIVSKKSHYCLLTMIERKSRYQLIFVIPTKEQSEIIGVIDLLERKYGKKKFAELFKSITTDNGTEFLDQDSIERSCFTNKSKPRLIMYYAHPYCSSERGAIERANGIIRRWVPKGADIGKYSIEEIQAIQNKMNGMYRKILGYRSAKELLPQLELTA